MMKPLQRRLWPIGIQTFSEVREKGYQYIDKTAYVYRMTHGSSKCIFLSRPRRFGKSLLTSTLHAYFAGRKELFAGLAIAQMETAWTQHPVLHFDMSLGKHLDKDALCRYIGCQLANYEQEYGITDNGVDINVRLSGLVRSAFRQTGKQVVVLIDEYDVPLLDVVHEEENLPMLRHLMRNFYSPLKACDPYLRFVFLTGITKFSQLSIFSELNNMEDISMDEPYAAICGITEEEMRTQMDIDIDLLGQRLKLSHEDILQKLKDNYDGYHFTWPSPDIYNPFSLLTAFTKGKTDAYWFGSGTPTYLIEMLRKYRVAPSEIGRRDTPAYSFDAPTERMTDITPLLYQSGYITIKGYDSEIDLYTLDIPNREVRIGLMKSLLPQYAGSETTNGLSTVAFISRDIRRGDVNAALGKIQTYLSTVPYCDNTHYEGHYQQLLYVIFSLLGAYVDVEVRTPRSRVDIVLRTQTALYLMELKMNQNANAALHQINLKQYPERFALCGLPVIKVGISFDSERRTIGGWKIE